MPDEEIVLQPKSDDKSRYLVTGLIIFFLLALSFCFFWYGNIAYGVVMIGVPALALIITAVCYLLGDKEQDDVAQIATLIQQLEANEGAQPRNPLVDRPPSYRMTWRRSFMKRFRNRSTLSPRFTREMTTFDPNMSPRSNSSITSSPTSPPKTENLEGHSEDEGSASNKEDEREKKQQKGVETIPKGQVTCQDSLPTYSEAMEILRSREDLS